jgi:hypothetical protein
MSELWVQVSFSAEEISYAYGTSAPPYQKITSTVDGQQFAFTPAVGGALTGPGSYQFIPLSPLTANNPVVPLNVVGSDGSPKVDLQTTAISPGPPYGTGPWNDNYQLLFYAQATSYEIVPNGSPPPTNPSDTAAATFNGYELYAANGINLVPTPYTAEILYSPYIWIDAGPAPNSNTLTITSPNPETATIQLAANSSGSITSAAQTGSIDFTDTDPTTTPTGSIENQTVTVTDTSGKDVTAQLTQSQISALEAAFTIAPAPGNTNNGAIDWTYDPQGTALEFLTAGETAVVTSTVQITDQDGNSASDNVVISVTGQGGLFTTGADNVDFNNLTAVQQAAIAGGADIYHGLGGNDVVTLPNKANYNESVGNGKTLNWVAGSTFHTGDTSGQSYTITGGDGIDTIQLGAGNDIVFGSPGNDTIIGGAGQVTFDYQAHPQNPNARFGNFNGFAPGTVQTITGGHSVFVTNPTQQNLLLLPGSLEDYTVAVNFQNGDSLADTVTTLTTTGSDGLPKGITFNTTDVEKVEFASPPALTELNGSVAVAMLELASEVYGLLPTLGHAAEPLAYQSNGLISIAPPTVADDAEQRGWIGLSAIEMGMASADFGSWNNLDYSFSNGFYQAEDITLSPQEIFVDSKSGVSGDHAEANALVLEGNVNGKLTLAIAFRGTDQWADFSTYPNFQTYYDLYQPLVNAIDTYASDPANGIQQVLVSGHSLGAGTVQYLLQNLNQKLPSTIAVQAFTDGSPGAELSTLGNGTEIENFLNTNDLVTKAPIASAALPAAQLLTLILAEATNEVPLVNSATASARDLAQSFKPKQREGSSIYLDTDEDTSLIGSTTEHNNRFYVQEAGILASLADDPDSPFSGTLLGFALENNTVYQGNIQIALAGVGGPATEVPAPGGGTTQLPIDDTVHIQTGDAYCLAGPPLGSADRCTFIWNSSFITNFPSTSDLHTVDGGPSDSAIVILPGSRDDYTLATHASSYGPETDIDLNLPLILGGPLLNGLVGELYRVNEVLFAFGGAPYFPNGKPASVQTPAPGQTTVPVDKSFDYTDGSAGDLTINGSGEGGDIVAVGPGDVVNESGGNNTIFVMDPTATGNITLNIGPGDNKVFLGDTNSTIIGDGTFEPGGGNNVIVGESDPTVILRGNRGEYAISQYVSSDGQVHTFTDDLGAAGGGTDDLVNVQKVGFGDGSLLLLDGGGPLNVTSVSSSQTGHVVSGTIQLTLTMSEGVTVDTAGGPPILSLNDGANANYDLAASDPSVGTLVFDYAMGANDYSANLEITGVTLPSGTTVTDGNGFNADFRNALNAPLDVQIGNPTPGPNPPPPAGTTADMIMRDGASGAFELYNVGHNAILAAAFLGQVGLDWQFVGLGGFYGTDTSDMILRNSGSGAFEFYDISNNNITNAALLGTVGLDWQFGGFGDFSSRPGETDMILRNSSTAALEVYDISNNSLISAYSMGAVGLDWQVAGFGDFSSSPNETDMIMRNSNTGALEVYDISNNTIMSAYSIGAVGLEWQAVGFGHFSGVANETDMIMRNSNTGAFEVYDIANNALTNAYSMGAVGLEWQVVGFGNFSGNANETDMMMRNTNTGSLEVYDIANNVLAGAYSAGAVGLNWQVGGVAPDGPSASTGSNGDSSVAQLVQAMAGFGGSSGATDPFNSGFANADMQPLLTTPQHT